LTAASVGIMVMAARVDGKRRYLTVYSCVAANAIIMLAAAAAKQQKGNRRLFYFL
jgi:hypothetical protein